MDTISRELQHSQPTELILHVGDIAYADGKVSAWTRFMHQVQPIASKVPYMVAVGNHEGGQFGYEKNAGKCKRRAAFPPGVHSVAAEDGDSNHGGDSDEDDEEDDSNWDFGDDSGGECGAMLYARFPMPGSNDEKRSRISGTSKQSSTAAGSGSSGTDSARRLLAASSSSSSLLQGEVAAAVTAVTESGPMSNPPFWYSFDYASVHFVTISTEHSLARGSPQMVWLQYELENVDRCRTPWLVVVLHRPMYVVYPHKQNREVRG